MANHIIEEVLRTHRELRDRCLEAAREYAEYAPVFVQRARDNNRIVVQAKRRLREFAA